MIQPEFLKTIHGDYKIAGSNAVTDTALLQAARDYEENQGHKIAALNPREIAARFTTDAPVLVTRKYDGEGVFVYFEAVPQGSQPAPKKPEIFAFNAWSGRVRVGLPALGEMAARLKSKGVRKALLRAELYLPGRDSSGRRLNNADVVRVSFNGTDAQIASLRLAAIRLVMLDGANWGAKPAGENHEKLASLLPPDNGSQAAHIVDGAIAKENEVGALFKQAVEKGFEGVVISRLTRPESFKIKPVITIDAAVIGYVEGEAEGKRLVRSLLTALTYKETGHTAHFQVFARVFSKMDDATAEKLLPVLQARKVAQEPLNAAGGPFAITDSDNRPVTFVTPGLIVQVEGDELVTARNDLPNRTQLMRFADGKWTFLKMAECPRLSFATFGGLREDKTLAGAGARIDQVSLAPLNAEIPPQAAPTVLVRKVWTKILQGKTAVKKLLLVSTGSDSGKFPYVLLQTEFSPNRAKPLETDVQFAMTRERADQLVNAFLSTIKKGWVETTAQEPRAAPSDSAPSGAPKTKPRKRAQPPS